MPIAWQIEQTGWTGRDWTWKCSLFRFSGHLGPWTAFNVKKKLTTAYATFYNNWGIFFKYSEHRALIWVWGESQAWGQGQGPSLQPSPEPEVENPTGQFDFKIVAQIWKIRFQQYLFAKFLPTLHYISQQDMNWGCPCRLWRQEDRPNYPGSWLRSAPRTILLQKILMW